MHCRVAKQELATLLKGQGKKSFDAMMRHTFDATKSAWAVIMKTEEDALVFHARALLPFIQSLKKEIADAIAELWGERVKSFTELIEPIAVLAASEDLMLDGRKREDMWAAVNSPQLKDLRADS